jgi:hypothetical protein
VRQQLDRSKVILHTLLTSFWNHHPIFVENMSVPYLISK